MRSAWCRRVSCWSDTCGYGRGHQPQGGSFSHVWSKFGSSAPKLVEHEYVPASDPAGGRGSPTQAGRGEEGLSAAPRSSPCLPVALPPSASTHLLCSQGPHLSCLHKARVPRYGHHPLLTKTSLAEGLWPSPGSQCPCLTPQGPPG